MKEKIEEILEAYTNYGFGENLDNVIEMEFKMKTPTGKVGEYIGYPSLVNELTTLIQEERKKDREMIYKDIQANYHITADEFYKHYLQSLDKGDIDGK